MYSVLLGMTLCKADQRHVRIHGKLAIKINTSMILGYGISSEMKQKDCHTPPGFELRTPCILGMCSTTDLWDQARAQQDRLHITASQSQDN